MKFAIFLKHSLLFGRCNCLLCLCTKLYGPTTQKLEKNSVFDICVEVIIYLLSYNLYDCNFNVIRNKSNSIASHTVAYMSYIRMNLKESKVGVIISKILFFKNDISMGHRIKNNWRIIFLRINGEIPLFSKLDKVLKTQINKKT